MTAPNLDTPWSGLVLSIRFTGHIAEGSSSERERDAR